VPSPDDKSCQGQPARAKNGEKRVRKIYRSIIFRDLIIISGIIIFVFWLGKGLGLFKFVAGLSQRQGAWKIDEFFILLVIVVFAFGIFSLRRWRELRDEISERERAEENLQSALSESRHHEAEISALLEGSRAVLEHHEFEDAARFIFDSCKKLIGATSGYIALLSQSEKENEVLFLDSGGFPCTVDPSLPMPIRGLRAEAYRTGKPVCRNDFSRSEYMKFMPPGHVTLDNVLFAPLVIKGKTLGLMGLANKPGGFNENDTRIVTAFGEHAAIALYNSRVLETLENSEERFRSVAQTANDAIISVDRLGKIVFWNLGAENMFGHLAQEVVDKPLWMIIPEPFREAHRQGMERLVATGESKLTGKTVELVGLRKDGREFPLELSLATWKTKEGSFFTGIIRDITERKRAEEEIKYLAKFPAENPSPVLRVHPDGTLLYANDSSRELLREWGCGVGGLAPPFLRNLVKETLQAGSKRITEVDCGEQAYAFLVAPVGDAGYVNLYGIDITERKQMEKALRKAHSELETRVQERTAELVKANETLQVEINERKRAEKILQDSERQLRSLSSQLLTVQENERRRIARELHDGLGQTLAAVKFSLENKLSQMSKGATPPGISLENIILLVQNGIEEARRIYSDLWPSILDDLGILATIGWFCRQFQTIYTSMQIEKQIGIREEDVPNPLKTVIYRILQEAMNNASKYSQASIVAISLRKVNGAIELVIEDNGLGFDLENCGKGLGLASMKERAELSGGSLAISSIRGKGTVVRASWRL
jgi:PAS domain S-box-containing protein